MPSLLFLSGPHAPTLRARAREMSGGVAASRALLLGARDEAAFCEPEAWFEREVAATPNAPRLLRAPERTFLLRELLSALKPQLGPLRALANSSDLLRQLDVLWADAHRAELQSLPPDGDWSDDLALLWNAYQERVRELGALDVEAAPTFWAQSVAPQPSPTESHNATRFEVLLLDNVLAPSPALWRGLTALAQRCERVIVLATAPGISALPEEFSAWPGALAPTLAARAAQLWHEWAARENALVEAVFCPHPDGFAALRPARALLGLPDTPETFVAPAPRETRTRLPEKVHHAEPEPQAASFTECTTRPERARKTAHGRGVAARGHAAPQLSLFEIFDAPKATPNQIPPETPLLNAAPATANSATANSATANGDNTPREGWCEVRLTLTSGATPREEMRRIARDIRARVDAGAQPRDFALFLPDAARYAGTLEAAFAEHNLALNVRRARPHATYPVVRRALALLQLAIAPKFSVDAVTDVFGDGLFVLRGENGDTFDTRAFASSCRAFSRATGARLHELDDHALEQMCATGEFRALPDASDNGAANGHADVQVAQAQVANAANPNASLLAPLLRLRVLGARLSAPRGLHEVPPRVRELLTEVAGHLHGIDVENANAPSDDAELASDELKREALKREAWPQIEAVLNALERAITRGRELGRGRAAWLLWLNNELELEAATLQTSVANVDAVRVLSAQSLEDDAGASVLYLGGLLEGEWPDTGVPGTLYARHARQFADLRAHRAEPSSRARHGLSVALCHAREVHLSYPATRAGRESSRSPLIEDALALWPDLPALPAPSQPVSRLESLRAAGREAANGTWDFGFGSLAEDSAQSSKIKDQNPPCASLRALDLMRRDRQSSRPGIYSGALGHEAAGVLQKLLPQGDVQSWTAPQLGRYARCPWRFWHRDVLRLRPMAQSRDDLPRSARGRLLHQIVEEFELQWARAVTPERFEEAWQELSKLARVHIERLPLRPILREAETIALLGNRELRMENEELQSDSSLHSAFSILNSSFAGGVLGRWLRARCAPDDLPALGFAAQLAPKKKPAFGDWARPTRPLAGSDHVLADYFGGGAAWDWALPLNDHGAQVTGRIDRLEISGGGELLVLLDEQDRNAWLLPGWAEIASGLDFNLPLALLAARQSIQSALDREAIDDLPEAPRLAAANVSLPEARTTGRFGERGSFGRNAKLSTGRQEFTRNLPGETQVSPDLWWRTLETVLDNARRVTLLIQNGAFALSPHETEIANCRTCDARAACRRDETLVSRRRAELQNDAELRAQTYWPERVVWENADEN